MLLWNEGRNQGELWAAWTNLFKPGSQNGGDSQATEIFSSNPRTLPTETVLVFTGRLPSCSPVVTEKAGPAAAQLYSFIFLTENEQSF